MRKAQVLGKWVEHGGWGSDWQLRFFRKSAYFANHEEIHGGFDVRGPKGKLEGVLYHYTYPSLFEYLRKMNEQTSLHVSNKLAARRGGVGWTKIVLSPISYFYRMYISNKGYKDGMHGFLLAVYSALYTLLLYSKTWEFEHRKREGKNLLPPITNQDITRARERYHTMEPV
jgi:hypothetical protein